MHRKLDKYMNKNIGIMIISSSVLFTALMMLMIDWQSNYNFMENLSRGYLFSIEYGPDCIPTSGTDVERFLECNKPKPKIYIDFKYVAIFPALASLIGLWAILNTKK